MRERVAIGILAVLVVVAFVWFGSAPERPYAYVRLGKLRDFLASETYIAKHNLLLRRDNVGLAAMSTLCSYDLSPLAPKSTPKGSVLASNANSSQYDAVGNVIRGPARSSLPYFELEVGQARYGGPVDTLFVSIGKEVSPKWRLPVVSRKNKKKR